MSQLSHFQADSVRDAVALVRIIQRHGTKETPESRRDVSAIIDDATSAQLSGIIGVLIALAAHVDEDYLDEMARNTIRMRP